MRGRNLECEDQHYRDNMQALIEPDGADDFVAGLEGIDDVVGDEQEGDGEQRWMGKEDEDGGIGGAVVKIDLPAFPLLDTHPGTLKGKISNEVAGKPDQ